MTPRLSFKSEAETDIDQAYKWYRDRSARAGVRFLREVDATLARIERNPLGYQRVFLSARRATLRRFSFGIFFIVREQDIVVIACVHDHRDPSVWQQRL